MIVEVVQNFNQKLVQSIKDLEIENFGKQAAANQWLIPVFIEYGKVVIAKSDSGKLLGVCLAIKSWHSPGKAFIYSFHLCKTMRRQGLGTKLLLAVIEMLKKDRVSTVALTVAPENKAAINLYKKMGFVQKGLKKDLYGPGVDRLLMDLTL